MSLESSRAWTCSSPLSHVYTTAAAAPNISSPSKEKQSRNTISFLFVSSSFYLGEQCFPKSYSDRAAVQCAPPSVVRCGVPFWVISTRPHQLLNTLCIISLLLEDHSWNLVAGTVTVPSCERKIVFLVAGRPESVVSGMPATVLSVLSILMLSVF